MRKHQQSREARDKGEEESDTDFRSLPVFTMLLSPKLNCNKTLVVHQTCGVYLFSALRDTVPSYLTYQSAMSFMQSKDFGGLLSQKHTLQHKGGGGVPTPRRWWASSQHQ